MAHRSPSPAEQALLEDLGSTRPRVVQLSTPARVADALRERISEGAFAPGTQLREEAIADALRVSRNTVREAFVELAGDRLVVREPNRGVFVASLTMTDVLDIFAARRTIEEGAVRRGGSRVLVANARLAVTDGVACRQSGDSAGLAQADRHFHRALVSLANSTRLNRAIRQMLAELRWVLNSSGASSELFAPYVQDNERICELMEAGKFAAAARAVDKVLTLTEKDVVNALRANGS